MRSTLQQAIAFEREEVVVHGGRRGEADAVRDLANRGGIAPFHDRARDALEDLLTALGVVARHLGRLLG